MNSNTFLRMFGLNPDDFEPSKEGLIECEYGYMVDLVQKVDKDKRICPRCKSTKCYSKGHYFGNYIDYAPDDGEYVFNITRQRLKCQTCGLSFTPPIKGILPYSEKTLNVERHIVEELKEKMTFSAIARKRHLSVSYIIKVFDQTYTFVPRGEMPEILCIDEFYFSRKADYKYCCCLVDFQKRELLDIIQSRQKPFLDEYFDKISFKERSNVKYFVSDMYDGYAYVRSKYFPKSIHVIDLFHVISLLTNAISSVRCQVIKQRDADTYLDRFMKNHWETFMCKYEKIPDKYYSPQTDDGVVYHYQEMVTECIKLDQDFWEGWNVLQDILHYKWYGTYDESLSFIIHMSERLKNTENDTLKKVGQSYYKWRYEIANGFVKNEYHIHISNGIAECINNNIKTVIKLSYGYRNFQRFRKRCLLIYLYNK